MFQATILQEWRGEAVKVLVEVAVSLGVNVADLDIDTVDVPPDVATLLNQRLLVHESQQSLFNDVVISPNPTLEYHALPLKRRGESPKRRFTWLPTGGLPWDGAGSDSSAISLADWALTNAKKTKNVKGENRLRREERQNSFVVMLASAGLASLGINT